MSPGQLVGEIFLVKSTKIPSNGGGRLPPQIKSPDPRIE